MRGKQPSGLFSVEPEGRGLADLRSKYAESYFLRQGYYSARADAASGIVDAAVTCSTQSSPLCAYPHVRSTFGRAAGLYRAPQATSLSLPTMRVFAILLVALPFVSTKYAQSHNASISGTAGNLAPLPRM